MQSSEEQHWPLVIGVDIGGTQLRVGVMRGAQLLSRVGMLTGADPAPSLILPRLFQAVEVALAEAATTIEEIAGIGISAPGPLDPRTGIVHNPPNMPGWDDIPLRDLFNERFPIPVFVENDANASGLGEYMFGAGRGCQDMVYLTISTGIGGGVILDGKILEGVSGTAAELGHMTIDWHGERCTCGSTGCLEYIASGTAIARQANEAIRFDQGSELLTFARSLLRRQPSLVDDPTAPSQQPDDYNTVALRVDAPDDLPEEAIEINARVVSLAAEAGIPLARAIIARAAEALGVGFVNIIHCFNPERIILGGGVTLMGSMLLEPALRIVQERAMRVPRDAVRIELAQLGENTGLIGSGALVYYYA